ncbi:MAG: response regulator [Candidatus Sumerlaeia bacterium]|nr:response regulator [Candidatus Sumerlaeia bacterium]
MADESKTILIVDDDEDIRQFLSDLLASEGYPSREAGAGHEGVEAALRFKPALILLDIMMPGMDGYEVCERLKADPTTRDIPIVMVTVRNDIADISRSLVTGASGFVVKPFDPECLLKTVAMILSGRPFEAYQQTTPVVLVSPPPPAEGAQVAFLDIMEPGGCKSILHAASRASGNTLVALWQFPQDEGVVQSTGAILTESNRAFHAVLEIVAGRPTVKILACQIHKSTALEF